jgi:hypothetical protein
MSTTSATLANMVSVESKTQETLNRIRQKLTDDIARAKNNDVVQLAPNICIVRMSTLRQKDVWSPEYYLQASQADYVLRALNTAPTATAMVNRIRSMVEKASVTINGNAHRLNDDTLEYLKAAIQDIPVIPDD